MNLSFDVSASGALTGQTQKIKTLSESWAAREVYCVNCESPRLMRFPNNQPAADLYCTDCSEQYELKSGKGPCGRRLPDGAYAVMVQRVTEPTGPNLLVLRYDSVSPMVTDLFVVPRHFLTPDMIEARKPLSATARRAGWIGCKIALEKIPQAGRISLIQSGNVISPPVARAAWRKTLFLQEARHPDARGWLLSVIRCIEAFDARTFRLQQLYDCESDLRRTYPGNQHIREKIRQQLQVLRDRGFLEFHGGGKYSLTPSPGAVDVR